jgi:hypothetical protein
MKRIKKIKWQVGYYCSLYWGWWVGDRWRRASWWVWWRVVGRARQSVRDWRLCGSVPEWRPVRACRRLALVWSVRVVLGVAALVLGPWLVGLLLRWLCG